MALGAAVAGSRGVLDKIANPTVVNPLAAVQGAAQTAGTMYDLRAKQAEQAIGGILQQSTDANGNVDYQKAHLLASKAGPDVQMGMQKMLLNTSQLRSQQLEQAHAHLGNVGAASLSIVNDPSDANLAQVRSIMLEAGYPQAAVDQHISTMQGMDEGQRRAYALKFGLSNLDPAGRFGAAVGTTGVANMPQGLVPYVQGGILSGGRLNIAPGGVGSQLSPGQQTEYQKWLQDEVDIPDPKNPGAVMKGTRLQKFQQMGVDPRLYYPGGSSGGGGGASPAPGSSTLPPSLRNPPNAGTPLPTPSGADIKQQEQSVDEFKAISDKAVASRDRSAILGNMLGDVGQFTSGPLAGIISRGRNFGINLKIPGLNVEGQTAQESFNKLAAQLANSQGAGSDARMNVNVEANPHQELSPAGVTQMIHQLQGNEDYLQARAKAASAYPDQKASRKFESEVGTQLDPRAFQFARMSQPERQTYVKNLSAQDKAAVQKSYNWAVDKGLISGG